MEARIIKHAEELRKKNGEYAEYSARLEVLESKMAALSQEGQRMITGVVGEYHPEDPSFQALVFKGCSGVSLDFLIGIWIYI